MNLRQTFVTDFRYGTLPYCLKLTVRDVGMMELRGQRGRLSGGWGLSLQEPFPVRDGTCSSPQTMHFHVTGLTSSNQACRSSDGYLHVRTGSFLVTAPSKGHWHCMTFVCHCRIWTGTRWYCGKALFRHATFFTQLGNIMSSERSRAHFDRCHLHAARYIRYQLQAPSHVTIFPFSPVSWIILYLTPPPRASFVQSMKEQRRPIQ
jgi:hypothetical protein